MILHDLRCPTCSLDYPDFPLPTVPDRIVCVVCGGEIEIVYGALGRRNAQWGDGEVAVVYRDGQGKIYYPTHNNQPTPPGRERVEIRSLAEMQRFERDHNVVNEAAHYDKGTGNGFETGDRHDGRPVNAPRWDPLDFGGR